MRILSLFALLSLAPLAASCQWELQDSHVTAEFRGVAYLGNGIAWVSGTRGTVLRTENMGKDWRQCAVPPGAERLDFRGLHAFDKNTAIVMSIGKGDQSRLYETTNACQTWNLLVTNTDKDGFWDNLNFQNRNVGVLLGDPVDGKLYARVTTDGGKTWRRFGDDESLKTPDPNSGVFAASNSALLMPANMNSFFAVMNKDDKAVTVEATFGELPCKRAPGSKTPCPRDYWWHEPHDLKLGHATPSSGVFGFGLSLSDDGGVDAMVAVGGDYLKPDATANTAAYASGTGSWSLAATPPHGFRSAVAYDENTHTWIAVGPNGTDISKDDGKSWRPLTPGANDAPDADRRWNSLSLPFVVGSRGRIGLLRDGALTMQPSAAAK